MWWQGGDLEVWVGAGFRTTDRALCRSLRRVIAHRVLDLDEWEETGQHEEAPRTEGVGEEAKYM